MNNESNGMGQIFHYSFFIIHFPSKIHSAPTHSRWRPDRSTAAWASLRSAMSAGLWSVFASTAKQVEAVDGVEHGVAVYAIVTRVAALHRVDGAAEIALFVQYVVQLQRHGKGVAFQETLAKLHVPYQLVGVHRTVVACPSLCSCPTACTG